MVPGTKEELRHLVTETTLETYEELSYQLVRMLDQVKHNEKLSEYEKNDEVMLNIMGYIKSCTNEIIIEVLGEILGLNEKHSHEHHQNQEHGHVCENEHNQEHSHHQT
ncbi:MAG: hypothetical protein SOZ59_01915 [Candidatus Limivivens sp.]|nr:hypothetical protein [Candidatus Limivivens sp.]